MEGIEIAHEVHASPDEVPIPSAVPVQLAVLPRQAKRVPRGRV